MDGRGTRSHFRLRTTVSPGHPLCKACHVPLEVVVEPNAVTRTRCPQCNDGATYALPPNAPAVYGALRGIIAGEQRTDRPVARTAPWSGRRGGGGLPACGAALAAGEGEMVKCTFCSMTSRVPGKLARRQRQGAPPPMVPFWVLLEGCRPAGRSSSVVAARTTTTTTMNDDDDGDDLGMPRPPSGPRRALRKPRRDPAVGAPEPSSRGAAKEARWPA